MAQCGNLLISACGSVETATIEDKPRPNFTYEELGSQKAKRWEGVHFLLLEMEQLRIIEDSLNYGGDIIFNLFKPEEALPGIEESIKELAQKLRQSEE